MNRHETLTAFIFSKRYSRSDGCQYEAVLSRVLSAVLFLTTHYRLSKESIHKICCLMLVAQESFIPHAVLLNHGAYEIVFLNFFLLDFCFVIMQAFLFYQASSLCG